MFKNDSIILNIVDNNLENCIKINSHYLIFLLYSIKYNNIDIFKYYFDKISEIDFHISLAYATIYEKYDFLNIITKCSDFGFNIGFQYANTNQLIDYYLSLGANTKLCIISLIKNNNISTLDYLLSKLNNIDYYFLYYWSNKYNNTFLLTRYNNYTNTNIEYDIDIQCIFDYGLEYAGRVNSNELVYFFIDYGCLKLDNVFNSICYNKNYFLIEYFINNNYNIDKNYILYNGVINNDMNMINIAYNYNCNDIDNSAILAIHNNNLNLLDYLIVLFKPNNIDKILDYAYLTTNIEAQKILLD